MKRKTSARTNSINHSPLRGAFILIALVLAFAWFALSPHARATCQEGCLTNNNTVLGDDALLNNTTGHDNTATGFDALLHNMIGSNNTANGSNALFSNTKGSLNTATGSSALVNNTTGSNNTATGFVALQDNTTAGENTATGSFALQLNTTGSENTATGSEALAYTTPGSYNTPTGAFALFNNTTASNNTANGYDALLPNTTGGANTAAGAFALQFNTSGFNNTANGLEALRSNTTGFDNTANGVNALFNNTTGGSNVALGNNAGMNLTTGSNNIDIGNVGMAGESKRIRIGTSGTQTKTFVAGISGVTVPGGVGVIVGTNGQLGTVVSSERFKDSIKPMDKASEASLALKPVTFRYKKELDPDGIPQFGLVAEDVEKVNPDLIARDSEGKVYTVRYDAVNAMLLNEFLKEHRKVEELNGKLENQARRIQQQQKQIEALTTGLQKVSDQLQLNKPAPRTVVSNQ